MFVEVRDIFKKSHWVQTDVCLANFLYTLGSRHPANNFTVSICDYASLANIDDICICSSICSPRTAEVFPPALRFRYTATWAHIATCLGVCILQLMGMLEITKHPFTVGDNKAAEASQCASAVLRGLGENPVAALVSDLLQYDIAKGEFLPTQDIPGYSFKPDIIHFEDIEELFFVFALKSGNPFGTESMVPESVWKRLERSRQRKIATPMTLDARPS
jgi:hypothetical protein